jgi:hypothetical protein
MTVKQRVASRAMRRRASIPTGRRALHAGRRSPARGALLAALGLLAAVAAPAGSAAIELPPDPSPEPTAPRLAYVTETLTSTSQAWLASATGAGPKRLGPGEEPLLSPNGQSVAVSLFGAAANPEHGPALGIYPASGAPVADFLELEAGLATPLAWSPDSRYLAVYMQSTAVTNIAAGSSLEVIDTQTGAVMSIDRGAVYGASFAHDGSDRLVFALAHSLSPSAPTNLYVSNADGSGLRRLTSDGRSLDPVWGPTYIAYDRRRQRREAPIYQIWLESPSGGAPVRRVTHIPVNALAEGLVPIAFSADGSRLVAQFEGQGSAWTVDVPGGHAREVRIAHRRAAFTIAAGISQDGGELLIDELNFEGPQANDRIGTVPFDGGPLKVLVRHALEASWNA